MNVSYFPEQRIEDGEKNTQKKHYMHGRNLNQAHLTLKKHKDIV